MADETTENVTGERSPDSQTPTPQLQDVLAENPLQADDVLSDNDSAYDDAGSPSYVTSLRSSIINYKTGAGIMHFARGHI
ncbi:hypothetical protein NKR23_g12064 [Pleurostoma richardsiae]|uniref:Uncharacterized protein n=1 Tax=Pleurostoma richardsiae TaxID=41990 RepID=A0AA38VGI3_9PEZI|nr:hypothetical protein NKR23_g12064 [Pleurostoma richardsiae]